MRDKHAQSKSVLTIHLLGGVVCVLIAGSSVYFAGRSISNRRTLSLNARQELDSTMTQLNDSIIQRTSLSMRVQALEEETADQPDLLSVRMLNARTADIVAMAESVNIRVDSLQPLERITGKRVPVQPLEFRGIADADDLFAFLGLLGDQMPDIHIQSIDILRATPEASEVQIVMSLYWFSDPADTGL